MERHNSFETKKKMTVLPPDPVFRFKSLGHLNCLCFTESFDKQNGSEEQTIADLPDEIQKTDNALTQKILMAAGEDGIVYFFDLEKNRLKYKQQMGHSIQSIHSFKSQVIIQEKAGAITIFHGNQSVDEGYKSIASIPCASGFCRSIYIKSSMQLLIPQENAIIEVYDLIIQKSQKYLHCIPQDLTNREQKVAELGQLMCMEYTIIEGASYVFAGFETGSVYMIQMNNDQVVAAFNFEEQLISITFDPVAMRGVVGGGGSNLEVFGVDKRSLQMKLQCVLKLTNPGCVRIKVRQDRKVLVCGGFDGRVRIYSWKTLRLLAVLAENHASVTDLQFSDFAVDQWRGRIMAVSGADGIVSLWCLYN